MSIPEFTKEKLLGLVRQEGPPEKSVEILVGLDRWLARGDGVAVYQNVDLSHPEIGHLQFASFGSPEAIFPDDPPDRLPDMNGRINWRYSLIGTYRGEVLQ